MDDYAKSKVDGLLSFQKGISIPFGGIKAWAEYQANQHWLLSPSSDARTRLIGPYTTSVRLSSGLSRVNEILLSQLRTGQCRLAGPLWRHLNNNQQLCRWCGVSPETIPHLILDCPHAGIKGLGNRVKLLRRRRNTPIMKKRTLEDLKQVAVFFRGIVELI